MFSALVPRVFPHCVQHFLHISTHFRVRDFRAEHWKRSVAKSASTLQVQSIRRKELAFSLLVSFQLTEIISALTNSHISTHRDLAKNYRLSWTEFFFWIASGKRKKKQFCCIFFKHNNNNFIRTPEVNSEFLFFFFFSGYWHALVLFFGSFFFFQSGSLGSAMLVSEFSSVYNFLMHQSDHCCRKNCYVHV